MNFACSISVERFHPACVSAKMQLQKFQMRRRYKVADFEPHIKDSGGIISTIAKNVGCDWLTAKLWIDKNATLKVLYEAECETILDVAESVVYGNVQAAAKLQADARKTGAAAIVDSADAKWLLTKKGKRRGYGDETEVKLGWAKEAQEKGLDAERLFDELVKTYASAIQNSENPIDGRGVDSGDKAG